MILQKLLQEQEVLLCYSNGLSHYEFPGGHLEENETLLEGLKREVLEETGIELENKDISPFYVIKYYYQNSIAIGDDENDISMFQTSGFSVAMGNSDSKIKDLADYVTTSNNSDGVAKFLERILNNQHK